MKNHNKRGTNKPTHISTGNVLDDLDFAPEEAAIIKLKTEIHIEILKSIKELNLSRRQLERIFDEPQPRISELMGGKISKMSVDKLMTYLFLLGKKIQIVTKARALTSDEKERLVA